MRPILPNQPEIEKLSKPLLDAMRMNNAAIQKGWNQEHHGDGTHGDITADSAAVTGTTVLGKLNLRAVIFNDPGTGAQNNLTVPGLSAVSWLRIFPGGALDINGIDATGREVGDLLLLTNCGSAGPVAAITLRAENGGSAAANRFSIGIAVTDHVLQAGRGVWLIRDYDVNVIGGLRVNRWRILDEA